MVTYLLTFIVGLMSIFAQQQNEKTIVKGKILNSPSPYAILMEEEKQDTILIGTDGSFEFITECITPRVCTFMIPKVKLYHQLWLENGKFTHINLDVDTLTSLNITGDSKFENEFLNNTESFIRTFQITNIDDFLTYSHRMNQLADSLLDGALTIGNPLFVNYERKRLDDIIKVRQIGFFRELIKKGKSVDSDVFYNRFMSSIDLDNEKLTYNVAYSILEWKSLCVSKRSERDLFVMIKILEDLVMNSSIKDELAFHIARMYITSGEQTYRKEIYTLAQCLMTDFDKKRQLSIFYGKDTQMRTGKSKMPTFNVMTTDGVKVMFKTVCIKNVIFVDIWSTWCAPCCREIPYVAKLVKHYKDNPNIEFISLSIDQNVKNWKDFLSKSSHSEWKQYLIPNDEREAFLEKLAINGIPRFIVLDKDGNILDVNAPRPSSNGIIGYLNKWLELK